MNKLMSTRGILSLISLGCLLLIASLTLRVPTGSAAEAGQAFSISPPLIELNADPGDNTKATIKFTNISGEELLVKTQFNDFGAKNETGEPNIIFEDNADTGRFSLRQWITSPEPFRIASQETKTVEFPINVPEDAEPGGHYAVIRFTGTSPELEESGVALTASIGSLVLMRVSGDIKEQASVADFFTATPQYENSSFFEYAPVTFVERIRNLGNIHVKPTGTVKISNMFGNEVATLKVNGSPDDANDSPRSVLPNSIRRFDQKLDNGWMFGRYQAELNLSYGQEPGKQLVSTTNFWVIPYKLLLLAVAILVGLFFLLRFAVKKYNTHIIKKAQHRK